MAAAYSYFFGTTKVQPAQIPLSQVAADVSAGKVSAITVNDDGSLDLTYLPAVAGADSIQKVS